MAAAGLISRHPDAWRRAVTHPFLDAVRDGSLTEASFESWLSQDYLFIADLLAFQASLLTCAPRAAQRTLAAGLPALEAELTWFEQSARERGLTLATVRHPTTDAYRATLVRLLEAGAEPALTGLWTLERAYLEAWRGAAPGASGFRAFVEHWTVPQFADYVADLEALAGDGPGAEAAFLEVCNLERAFWDMAWTFDA
jgi:formylaminopyrimidine deformylase / aminopyrimidine aminohydrolase